MTCLDENNNRPAQSAVIGGDCERSSLFFVFVFVFFSLQIVTWIQEQGDAYLVSHAQVADSLQSALLLLTQFDKEFYGAVKVCTSEKGGGEGGRRKVGEEGGRGDGRGEAGGEGRSEWVVGWLGE